MADGYFCLVFIERGKKGIEKTMRVFYLRSFLGKKHTALEDHTTSICPVYVIFFSLEGFVI